MTTPTETIVLHGKTITISTAHRRPYSKCDADTWAETGPCWNGESTPAFTEFFQAS